MVKVCGVATEADEPGSVLPALALFEVGLDSVFDIAGLGIDAVAPVAGTGGVEGGDDVLDFRGLLLLAKPPDEALFGTPLGVGKGGGRAESEKPRRDRRAEADARPEEMARAQFRSGNRMGARPHTYGTRRRVEALRFHNSRHGLSPRSDRASPGGGCFGRVGEGGEDLAGGIEKGERGALKTLPEAVGRRSEDRIRYLVGRLEEAYGEAVNIPRFAPLEELVSCIMSQHGSDVSTYPAFTRLLETYPTWGEVVGAGPEAVAETIRSAGLANQKARSILSVLTAIEARFGAFTLDPLYGMATDEAYAWLVSLPGVGPKTANLVLSFSFGRDRVPVDTHVGRVSARYGLLEPKTNDAKAHAILNHLCPPGLAFRFHAALIQHGRLTCKAPKPDCPRCVVRETCRYFEESLAL